MTPRISKLLLILQFITTINAFIHPFFNLPSKVSIIRTNNVNCHSTNTDENNAIISPNTLLNNLARRFQGDFDNYHQVLSDRKQNLFPGKYGGHEHIHCTLIPIHLDLESDAKYLLAAYYFDGIPNRIFRLRFYTLEAEVDEEKQPMVRTKLYTLNEEMERLLRQMFNRPMEWNKALQTHILSHSSKEVILPFQELKGCDVVWKLEPHPIRHSYLSSSSCKNNAHHAIMPNEDAIVESTIAKGTLIHIQDELSLWDNELWINDRGLDPETKEYIYGNQRGVPYKMERVTSILQKDGTLQRDVVNSDLAWTLGEEFRTEEEYVRKMDAICGVSTQFNLPLKQQK